MIGNGRSSVVLLEASDYECEFCRQYYKTTFPGVYRKYVAPGRVAYAFVAVANERIHPHALPAARASFCAARQGKFLAAHDRLMSFDFSSVLSDALLSRIAIPGIDETAFQACLRSTATTTLIRDRRLELKSRGIRTTPAFLFGTTEPGGSLFRVSRTLEGTRSVQDFDRIIEDLLRESPKP